MRLSIAAKLLLISLVLLALPWLGFRYIGEMRSFVLQGRVQAQTLAAQALASALAGHDGLAVPRGAAVDALYVYPLRENVEVDGYAAEWDGAARQPVRFGSGEGAFSLLAGERGGHLLLLLEVQDRQVVYRYPGRRPFANGDHLRIALTGPDGGERRFLLAPEGPGGLGPVPADAAWRRSAGETPGAAGWQETGTGYRVEIELPAGDLDRLSVSVVDVDGGGIRSAGITAAPDIPLVRPSRGIERMLAGVATVTSAAWVVDGAGWVRAAAGEHGAKTRLNGPLIRDALAGKTGIERHAVSYGGVEVIRVAVPIRAAERVAGALLLEQDTGDVLYLQLDAFERIALESLAVLLAIISALLLFAWRLAWRIRRLGRETDAAIDGDGRVQATAIAADARGSDELGGLSRGISGMLGRLSRYTRFLERMPRTLRHEINNPLNVIATSLHNYREQHPQAAPDPYLQSADRAVRRMDLIVRGMTEAASLEESLRKEEKREMDLAALAAGYAEGCAALHPGRRIRYTGMTQGALILGSDLRLEQLLDKLLDNALDFTPEAGEILLEVTGERGEALLRVANDGPPIPEAVLETLFESMVSARPDGGDGRPHLGIGLFVARGIAEFHGGSLEGANREDGRGVVFRVRVPLAG